MKAKQIDGNITTYKILPSEYKKADGKVILNFRNADTATLEAEGFYDVVFASYDPLVQNKGGLEWDSKKKIFTNKITDKDFNVEQFVLDEDGEPTEEKEKVYKIADIKASKLAEIKGKANRLLQPTDWQIIRKAERDVAISSDVVTERAKILTEANRLEAEVNAKKTYKTVLQYQVAFFPKEEVDGIK